MYPVSSSELESSLSLCISRGCKPVIKKKCLYKYRCCSEKSYFQEKWDSECQGMYGQGFNGKFFTEVEEDTLVDS